MTLKITNSDGPNIGVLNRWADGIEAKQNALDKKIAQTHQAVVQVQATVSTPNVPSDPAGVSTTQAGYVNDGTLYSEVTATYTAPTPLGSFAGVFLVAKNYRGSAELVKIAEHTFTGAAGGTANFKTILQRTGEFVTFYFVAKNSQEAARSDWINAPSSTATLNGGSPTATQAPVSAPNTVSNNLVTGGAIGQFVAGSTLTLPGTVEFDVQSTGGIVDVLLFASTGAPGPNGYMFRFDGRSGVNAGQVLIITNGTWSLLGTAKTAVNAATLGGWHHIEGRVSSDGIYDIFVDGVWQYSATDTTYAPTGATYYGYEVVANPVLAAPDFINRTLDHVANGTRAAWDTTIQKAAAVDSSGNLLLKNVAGPLATTSSPTTTSATFAVIPEMTSTITTKGNKITTIFTGTIANNTAATSGFIAVFADGVQISPSISFMSAIIGAESVISIVWLDSPSAASHTYDVRWKSNGTARLTAIGTSRTLQVVELG